MVRPCRGCGYVPDAAFLQDAIHRATLSPDGWSALADFHDPDDVCPTCGKYKFYSGICMMQPLPMEDGKVPDPIYQPCGTPRWFALPQKKKGRSAAGSAAAPTVLDGRDRSREGDPPASPGGLELMPGGFACRGRPHKLVGRPRDVLAALLSSHHRRCSVEELRKALGVNDERVNWPEQVVKDAAKDLRDSLRGAAKDAGVRCDNPLPSKGRGKDLAYILELA